jgi:hypothetical protein
MPILRKSRQRISSAADDKGEEEEDLKGAVEAWKLERNQRKANQNLRKELAHVSRLRDLYKLHGKLLLRKLPLEGLLQIALGNDLCEFQRQLQGRTREFGSLRGPTFLECPTTSRRSTLGQSIRLLKSVRLTVKRNHPRTAQKQLSLLPIPRQPEAH